MSILCARTVSFYRSKAFWWTITAATDRVDAIRSLGSLGAHTQGFRPGRLFVFNNRSAIVNNSRRGIYREILKAWANFVLDECFYLNSHVKNFLVIRFTKSLRLLVSTLMFFKKYFMAIDNTQAFANFLKLFLYISIKVLSSC